MLFLMSALMFREDGCIWRASSVALLTSRHCFLWRQAGSCPSDLSFWLWWRKSPSHLRCWTFKVSRDHWREQEHCQTPEALASLQSFWTERALLLLVWRVRRVRRSRWSILFQQQSLSRWPMLNSNMVLSKIKVDSKSTQWQVKIDSNEL